MYVDTAGPGRHTMDMDMGVDGQRVDTRLARKLDSIAVSASTVLPALRLPSKLETAPCPGHIFNYPSHSR